MKKVKVHYSDEQIKQFTEEAIEIWEPKYKNDCCLVAVYKIKDGDNFIKFTKAKHLQGMLFKVSGDKARRCSVSNNGKIAVYNIPMASLKRIC